MQLACRLYPSSINFLRLPKWSRLCLSVVLCLWDNGQIGSLYASKMPAVHGSRLSLFLPG